jgi:hypothetical protein
LAAGAALVMVVTAALFGAVHVPWGAAFAAIAVVASLY